MHATIHKPAATTAAIRGATVGGHVAADFGIDGVPSMFWKSEERVRLVDTATAAIYLGIAKNTLDKMRVYGRRDDNSPRFVKIGRSIRYDIAELDAYIARNTTVSTSEYCPG